MKVIYIFLASTIFWGLIACNDDYLDRYPTNEPTAETYFTSAEALELYTNYFYTFLLETKYKEDYYSDNLAYLSQPMPNKTGEYTVPTSLGSGGWSWTELRSINYFIENCTDAEGIDESDKQEQMAIAKYFRARFYFLKVRSFGDVPWYSKTLGTDDTDELYKARDSRTLVMDSVLADINYAVEYGVDDDSKNKITRWTALALKSRICLYEGTWRKYHTEANLSDADTFLKEAASASLELIDDGGFSLYSNGDEDDYYNFFNEEEATSDEVILAIDLADGEETDYNKNFTTTSVGCMGITRSLINEYLMADGSTFYDKYGNSDTVSWYTEHTDRDPRLAQTSMPMNFHRVDETDISLPYFGQNHTGYQVIKRVGSSDYDNGDTRDIVLIRYGEILLNYAEAMAELGTITQNDLDISINLLRDRVNMPSLTVSPDLDPYLDSEYEGTSDPLILEIRRERRVELATEGFRLDDLKRWKECHLLRENAEGIYAKLNTYMDRDRDGTYDLYVYDESKPSDAGSYSDVDFFELSSDDMGLSNDNDGRIMPYTNTLPDFEDWEYLDPIPTQELLLNSNLEQNPGWDEID